ncbi:hypothetical protein [Streptacidiphilus neutrinimicus]|uniref:hypothetical protein n=1 Tax=Streptacidiphilus neutrinimicus TaxID=105420 RepID=UPI0005A61663|nr:hypothetical protein [Streptacidiphilus neutrinimicus]
MPDAQPDVAPSWAAYRKSLADYRTRCGAPAWLAIDEISALVADQKRQQAVGPVPSDERLPRSTAHKLTSGDKEIQSWLQVQAFLHACHVAAALRGNGEKDTGRAAKALAKKGTTLPWMSDEDLRAWKDWFDALAIGSEQGTASARTWQPPAPALVPGLPAAGETPAPTEPAPQPRRRRTRVAAIVTAVAVVVGSAIGFDAMAHSAGGTPSAHSGTPAPPPGSTSPTPTGPSAPASASTAATTPSGTPSPSATQNSSSGGGTTVVVTGGGSGSAGTGGGPGTTRTGTNQSGTGGASPTPRAADPRFEVEGVCTNASAHQTLENISSGFTPAGQYKDVVLDPNGAVYPLYGYDHGTVNPSGGVGWSWPCQSQDQNGTYTAKVTDEASGKTVTATFVVKSYGT